MPSSSITLSWQLLVALCFGAVALAAPTLGHAQPNPGSKSAAAPSPPAKAEAKTAAPKSIRATFTCDAGKKIDATFVNGAYPDVTLVLSDGRHITVPQTMSASGARYASGSGIFVFWNKGDTAFIEENGKKTFSGCKTKR